MVTPTIPTARVTGAGLAALDGKVYAIGGGFNSEQTAALAIYGRTYLPGGAVTQGGGSGT